MDLARVLLRTWLVLLFTLAGLIQVSHAVTIDKIVAFGDSLSDNGNLYTLTRRAHKVLPMVPIIPLSPPYYEGRFTNGENWLDVMAKHTGVPVLVHAYGGAWAEPLGDSGLLVPFDINEQVGFYIFENLLDRHKDRHLFVIWAGSNDYLEGRQDVEYATTNTVKNIEKQVERLIYHGAHQLLVMGLPDISTVPEVVAKGSEAVAQVKVLLTEHNKKLEQMMKEQQIKHPDLMIIYLDTKTPFDDLIAHPEDFHLKNTTEACYGGYFYLNRNLADSRELIAAKDANIDIMKNTSLRVAYLTARLASRGGHICANPDEYLYWDHVHPTTVIHSAIAAVALIELGAYDIQWQPKI